MRAVPDGSTDAESGYPDDSAIKRSFPEGLSNQRLLGPASAVVMGFDDLSHRCCAPARCLPGVDGAAKTAWRTLHHRFRRRSPRTSDRADAFIATATDHKIKAPLTCATSRKSHASPFVRVLRKRLLASYI